MFSSADFMLVCQYLGNKSIYNMSMFTSADFVWFYQYSCHKSIYNMSLFSSVDFVWFYQYLGNKSFFVCVLLIGAAQDAAMLFRSGGVGL